MRRATQTPPFLDVAVRAARAGGRVLRRYYAGHFRVEYKGELDLLTEADQEAERAVLRIIRRAFPDHRFLAEESGGPSGRDDETPYKWIIDPLDGTTNFAHTFPMFCVSIALEVHGEIRLGVVYDPVRRELFTAEKGSGARLNGRPISVSRTGALDRALLVTGFAYNVRRVSDNNLNHFSNFILRAQGVRRSGTAALDLCYVASGRFDGFWELNLSPWDTAAGTIIAKEAGAVITDFAGKPFDIYQKQILASNGKIHNEMKEVLRKGSRELGVGSRKRGNREQGNRERVNRKT
jgi:myo-inositol-1(or 4)-monophosphatase